MSLHRVRRTPFFLAALAATTALAGCTSEGTSEPSLGEQQAAARAPAGDASTRAVSGAVTTKEGAPIAGAVITIPGTELAVISDADGGFVLTGVPLDEVILDVRAGHYESAELPVRPDASAITAILNPSWIPWPPATVKKGLTWVKALHDNARGQDQVSCHDYTVIGGPQSTTPTRSCDPYVGDTACNLARPILCLKPDGSGSNGHVWSFYNGWAAGNLGITHPIVGSTMTSLAVANAQCVAEFGAGWRMASHHDGNLGGGWQWRAYGNLNTLYAVQQPGHTLNHRFWVYILEGSGPSPWNPSNPPDSPNLAKQLIKDNSAVNAQLATAGNCWN